MEQFLYVHGDPGLNSYAEEERLGPLFEEAGRRITFWHEPSALRPHGEPVTASAPYRGSVVSLRKHLHGAAGRLTLICHSFGVHPALACLREAPGAAARIILLSPSLALHEALKNVMRLAMDDFRRVDVAKAARIQTSLEQTQTLMDPPMTEGLKLALQDPPLLTHYWYDAEAMRFFLDVLQRPHASLDVNSFFDTLGDFARYGVPADAIERPLDLPAIPVFGGDDPVSVPELEISHARRLFSTVTVHTFQGCGHRPHLERPEAFMRDVLEA